MFGAKKNAIKVRGYEVKRMAALPMLESVEELGGAVHEIMIKAFPGGDAEAFEGAIKSGPAGIVGLLMQGGIAAIPSFVAWLSRASGIPMEAFEDDADFGIGGLGETLEAVVKVNEFERFFTTALPAAKTVWQGINKELPSASAAPRNPLS